MALAEWIQGELKDQRIRTQVVQQTSSGLIQNKAKDYEDDIDELDHDRLPAAITMQQGRVDEIYREFDENPFDDLMYLEESTFRIERMARKIFRMRHLLDELSKPDPEAEGTRREVDDDS